MPHRHSIERPPKFVGIFDQADVKHIVEFMLHNYFRHWRLYKACFTKRLQVTISGVAPFLALVMYVFFANG